MSPWGAQIQSRAESPPFAARSNKCTPRAGPLLILVGAAFHDWSGLAPLAEALALRFTIINYDQRGRGESGDTPPYAVERKIEDLDALIAEAGDRLRSPAT